MSFDPHKRNVIAISSAMAVYYLGEGDIKGVSTLFGAINLQKPEVLIIGAWLMLLYSLWQYWIRARPHSKDYSVSWKAAIRLDLRFHKLAKEVLLSSDKLQSKDEISHIVERHQGTSNDGVTVTSSFLRKKFLLMIPGQADRAINQKKWSIALDILATKYMARTLLSEAHFSDYLLPYMFAATAFVIAVCKSVY